MPRRHITEIEAAQIIAFLQAGLSQRNVAERIGISRSAVNRTWIRFNQDGEMRRRPGQGRRRITTTREDRSLRRVAVRRRFITAREIRDQIPFQRQRVSDQTVRNRLREGDLRARRPAQVPNLSRRRYQRLRLHYARAYVNWRINQWQQALFVDESRFCLYGNDSRVRVWRHPGERYNEDCVQPRRAFNGGSVMVWGGISSNTRTPLVVIPPPSLNARRYIDMIVEPHIIPHLNALGQDFYLVQDNARPHTAHIVHRFLEERNINVFPHPPNSPDLNPIEHVWDILERRIRQLPHQPQNLRQLSAALVEAWEQIPQDQIRRCINMRQRLQEVINKRGGNTQY